MNMKKIIYLGAKSVGYPNESLDHHGTVEDGIRALIPWIAKVPFARKIEITVGLTQADLNSGKSGKTNIVEDLMGMINFDSDETINEES